MKRDELIAALRRLRVETGSLACLGCGHEHNCSTQGCAILRAAVAELDALQSENKALRAENDDLRIFNCDVEHVTRCRDCYAWKPAAFNEEGYIPSFCSLWRAPMAATNYCAHGVTKEEGRGCG